MVPRPGECESAERQPEADPKDPQIRKMSQKSEECDSPNVVGSDGLGVFGFRLEHRTRGPESTSFFVDAGEGSSDKLRSQRKRAPAGSSGNDSGTGSTAIIEKWFENTSVVDFEPNRSGLHLAGTVGQQKSPTRKLARQSHGWSRKTVSVLAREVASDDGCT